MIEFFVMIFFLFWMLLYKAEHKMLKVPKLRKKAWIISSIRPIVLFCSAGIYTICDGLEMPFPEYVYDQVIIGVFIVMLGILLCIKNIALRKEIQYDLEQGKKPSTYGS